MLEKLGQAKTHLELKKMIKEVDTTNTEAINYRDFVRMMLGPQSGVLKMYVDVVLWPAKHTQLSTSSYLYIRVYIYMSTISSSFHQSLSPLSYHVTCSYIILCEHFGWDLPLLSHSNYSF